MARWEPDSSGRLQQAALDLFDEQGFERTTVAQIAERAGVTERTFFRYFADKREVLFGGSAGMKDVILDAVADAPASASPLDAVAAGIEAAGALLQQRPEWVAQRQRVLAANVELLERELTKLADFASAVSDALGARGTGRVAATMAAEAGVAVFRVAVGIWAEEGCRRRLTDVVRESFAELRSVTAGP